MSDDENGSLDLLGVKGISESVKVATEGLVEGAGAFLSRICLPAAEEVGLLFKDRVSHWRAVQAARIVKKSEHKLNALSNSDRLHAHPRIVGSVISNGSWVDSDNVQEMWAGLLTSSCTEDGKDESNLMFVNLLSQLTASEARVLAYGSENSEKRITRAGLATIKARFFVTLDEIIAITGLTDIGRIDRELDHLRSVGLLYQHAGLLGDDTVVGAPSSAAADIAPSDLGLQMYVRCQGSRQSTTEYFGLVESQDHPSPETVLEMAIGE